ncbi:hypothetical protein J2W50_002762 [Herbaspirillum frisingense]|uniref:Uncharacterized protein n=1 Tax=Herbaspirillum frisingense TaxID=92645 RepID=A0ABU1PGD6_9BURK|nr:hypothetical protein [Herbaspirillum frisingense]
MAFFISRTENSWLRSIPDNHSQESVKPMNTKGIKVVFNATPQSEAICLELWPELSI